MTDRLENHQFISDPNEPIGEGDIIEEALQSAPTRKPHHTHKHNTVFGEEVLEALQEENAMTDLSTLSSLNG